MKTDSITRRVLVLMAVGVSLAFIAPTHLAASEPAPLRILLTNDDGFDAPGIKVVHKALIAAGHEVTVVAPLSNNSGLAQR